MKTKNIMLDECRLMVSQLNTAAGAVCQAFGAWQSSGIGARASRLVVLSAITAAMALMNVAFAAPDNLVQTVTYNSETITMRLTKENLRGSRFELWMQNSTGSYDVVTPVEERAYMGTIDEYPDAYACGILQDDGQFRGAVYFDRGVTWRTLGNAVEGTQAFNYAADTFTDYNYPSAATVSAAQGGNTMYGYDLGIDAENGYYTGPGESSVAKTFELIEYSVVLTRAIYMQNVMLRPYLGRVIIRTDQTQDPYTAFGGGDYLDTLRTHWNANHADANSDLVAGVTPHKVGGGLAWVGVVGTTSGYSVNDSGSSGAFDVVFRHEMGHNWNCSHFVGGAPEGTGLMGGNGTGRFSSCEAYRVMEHRDARAASGIVDSEGAYTAVELPPYASLDVAIFVQTVDTSVTVDVLANDHDANGQTLSLDSFDSVSSKGGAISLQGQNLVYTAPGNYIGTDYFKYVVTDTTGKTATGVVTVDVQPDDALKLYLALDEASGTTADDVSVFDINGAVSGADFSTSSIAGQYGNALNLDGTDDHITVSGVKLNSNTVTLTAWVKPDSVQNGWAGIIFDRSNSASGLNVGDSGELRYHWNDGNWGWNSGLTPAANVWTFVALVVEPNQATIYMNSGSGFQTAVNTTTHNAAIFATTYIGRDSASTGRSFRGGIDEVRVYGKAMTQVDLQDIFDGGGAEAPTPLDGATDVVSHTLRWAPGATAIANDIYVGTSLTAVANATQTSPEYAGTTANAFFKASLSDATTYYWRVDTATSSTTLTGTVWSFSTGTVQNGDTILVNFEEASNQDFGGGQLIGPTSVDSSNWNAFVGASGTEGSLIDNAGDPTSASIQWNSKNVWYNNDGTGDDQHKLSTGYLDDGEGVTVTLSNIPYANYKVYGLFASDQNGGGSAGTVNFNVNGSWTLGGDASTTAAAWGTIEANNSANGSYWTEIVPGSVQGNYWTVETSGSTCTIVGELGNGSNRGSLAAVIIEEIQPQGNSGPIWNNNPLVEAAATEGVAYSSSLADNASDPESDPLTFSKVSGPAWLGVSSNGSISGTPSSGDVGVNQWTVRVTDDGGLTADTTLEITVDATTPPPADPPGNPGPVNGATGVALNQTLTWDAANGADSYDIYFGTTAPGDFQGNQADLEFDPGALLANTTYYWRVDTVNASGTTTGTVWSFTTGSGGPSPLFSDDFESGSLSAWTLSSSRNVTAHSSGANGGVYGARLKKSSSMTATIDTSGVVSVTLGYDLKTSGMDNGESITVEWSADGTNWNTVESTNSTSWSTSNVVLPGGAGGQSALQIRFITNANRNNEFGYVDNVVVTGT